MSNDGYSVVAIDMDKELIDAGSLTQTGRVIIEILPTNLPTRKLFGFSTVFRQLKKMPALAINQDMLEKVLSKADTLKAWREITKRNCTQPAK